MTIGYERRKTSKKSDQPSTKRLRNRRKRGLIDLPSGKVVRRKK